MSRAELLPMLRTIDHRTAGEAQALRTAVVQTALIRAAVRYDLRRVIAFCPTITASRRFTESLPQTLDRLPAGHRPARPVTVAHVDGTMPARQRIRELDILTTPPDDGWAVVSNPGCLGEGLDLPAVDGVLYTAPKQSPIDIVQSASRALRRNPAGTGVSTIMVAFLLPDDPAQAEGHDDGEYDALFAVIRALREHDDTFAAALDDARRARRHEEQDDLEPRAELPAQIEVNLPAGYRLDDFLPHLTVRVLTATTSPWLDQFAAAQAYAAARGDLLVPQEYTDADGFRLGSWISNQRSLHGQGLLATDRVAQLESIGMRWNAFDARFETMLAAATRYVRDHGCLPPWKYVTSDGLKLGPWLTNCRAAHKAGRLSEQRRTALDTIGMTWETDDPWEIGLRHARTYHAQHGHLRAPITYKTPDSYPLGKWIKEKRGAHKAGRLSGARVAVLEGLGIAWDAAAVIAAAEWQAGIEAARSFIAHHGHLHPKRGQRWNDIPISTWITTQRARYRRGVLTPAEISELDGLGVTWVLGAHDRAWQRGLAAAQAYRDRHGHLRVPVGHDETGINLFGWLTVARRNRRSGTLTAARQQQLDSLGIDWNPQARHHPGNDVAAAAQRPAEPMAPPPAPHRPRPGARGTN